MANQTIQLGDAVIGEGAAPFLIAEIGLNHNGDLVIAKRLMDAANACGWHAVKFQKRTPEIATPEHQKNVMRDTPWGRITYLAYRYKVEFEDAEYRAIATYCADKPILWTASAWDVPSVDFLEKHDVPFHKVPSAHLTNDEMLVRIIQTGKPVLASTGMSTVEEIDHAVELLEKHGSGNYALMHTNSTYPTPPEELNLRAITFLKERYRCVIGYSGHEYDLEPTVIAATLGARIIERHVTLAHDMWGSDHHASLEVHAMDMLRKRLEDVDKMMGDGQKRVTESEKKVRLKLRGN